MARPKKIKPETIKRVESVRPEKIDVKTAAQKMTLNKTQICTVIKGPGGIFGGTVYGIEYWDARDKVFRKQICKSERYATWLCAKYRARWITATQKYAPIEKENDDASKTKNKPRKPAPINRPATGSVSKFDKYAHLPEAPF